MKKLPLVDLGAVHAEIGQELEEAVLRVCRSQRFIGGSELTEFEREFAETTGAHHAIGVANGTDAIELALRALEVGDGAEVLVPANTFIATAEAVVSAGARPRFVDVNRHSGLIDPESCRERIGERTRAIIPVHLYGRIAPMDDILEVAADHDLVVVEDAAQGHGAALGGRGAGTIGHAGTFSFYPGKNLGAFGDAGAVVTGDDGIAEAVRLMRDHGRRGRDSHVVIGVNSRLDALQAAVLRVKLRRLEEWTLARRRVAETFRSALDEALLDWRHEDPDAESHHLFPILVQDREALIAHLAENGVSAGVHYRHAVTQTEAFAPFAEPCPHAEWRARVQLSLPIHPYLAAEDVERVAGLVNDFAVAAEDQAAASSL